MSSIGEMYIKYKVGPKTDPLGMHDTINVNSLGTTR